MIGKPANRFQALSELFKLAATSAIKGSQTVATSYSDRLREMAIYNFDLNGGASWQDVRQEIAHRLFGRAPSRKL